MVLFFFLMPIILAYLELFLNTGLLWAFGTLLYLEKCETILWSSLYRSPTMLTSLESEESAGLVGSFDSFRKTAEGWSFCTTMFVSSFSRASLYGVPARIVALIDLCCRFTRYYDELLRERGPTPRILRVDFGFTDLLKSLNFTGLDLIFTFSSFVV